LVEGTALCLQPLLPFVSRICGLLGKSIGLGDQIRFISTINLIHSVQTPIIDQMGWSGSPVLEHTLPEKGCLGKMIEDGEHLTFCGIVLLTSRGKHMQIN